MEQIILDPESEPKSFRCRRRSWSQKISMPGAGTRAWNLSSDSTALVSVISTSLYHTITTRGQQLQTSTVRCYWNKCHNISCGPRCLREEIFTIITRQMDD